jgi:hypothetical protein
MLSVGDTMPQHPVANILKEHALTADQRLEVQYMLSIIGHNRDLQQGFLQRITPIDVIVDMAGDDQYQDMPAPAAIPLNRVVCIDLRVATGLGTE